MAESPQQSIIVPAVAATHYPPIHCIDYGDPGGGKTTFATTWPTPHLVFLFDGLGKDMPYRKWCRMNGGTETPGIDDYGTAYTDYVLPDGRWIRVMYFNDLAPDAGTWPRFEWYMKTRDFFTHGWQTVTLDSLTFMELCARMHARHVVNPNTKEPRQWFGYSTDALEYTLLVQLQHFPNNLLVLAHIDASKDEVLGTFVRQLAAPGRLTSRNELAAGYSELYRSYVMKDPQDANKNLYVLQTQRDTAFNCATQIDAPNPCWQDYAALWANWR